MQTRNAATAVARSAYIYMCRYRYVRVLSLRPFMQLHPTPLRAGIPRSARPGRWYKKAMYLCLCLIYVEGRREKKKKAT
jgi:hypothetical protein